MDSQTMLELSYTALALLFIGALFALRRWVPMSHRLFIPGLVAILVGMVAATWLFSRLLVEPGQ